MLLATVALAQWNPAIERWVMGSTGGEPTGAGELALNSTLGQPIIGSSSGGSVSIDAGYWRAVAAHYEIYLPLMLRSN